MPAARDGLNNFLCDCGSSTSVIDSRGSLQGLGVRRRRECLACKERFTTYECREHPALAIDQLIAIEGRIELLIEELRGVVPKFEFTRWSRTQVAAKPTRISKRAS